MTEENKLLKKRRLRSKTIPLTTFSSEDPTTGRIWKIVNVAVRKGPALG